ncbi:MAG: class C sortase [Lachnospiraceae bacterium]
MKKNIFKILIFVVFFLGLSMMLYPTVSDWYNKKMNSYVVSNYEKQISEVPNEEYVTMMEEARAFNQTLSKSIQAFENGSPNEEAYLNVFDDFNGIIGYIEIEKINVNLPIYHGTEESVLQKAIGHLEGSHFPTGDIGNNTVLTGHTGLPSADLFTGLIEIELGDTFTISVLDQVFTYEVYAITVVEPSEVSLLESIEGKDVVTLVTCTPYGINSHRLLVQGEQITAEDDTSSYSVFETVSTQSTEKESFEFDYSAVKQIITVLITFVWVFLFVVIIALYIRKRKGRD